VILWPTSFTQNRFERQWVSSLEEHFAILCDLLGNDLEIGFRKCRRGKKKSDGARTTSNRPVDSLVWRIEHSKRLVGKTGFEPTT